MKYLYLFIFAFLFTNCTQQANLNDQKEILSQKLITLDNHIDKKQALKISYTILKVSKDIKNEFAPIKYPWINNILVNIGIKKKGLCWEWRDELYNRLDGKIKPFDILKVVANKGRLNEHNAIVLNHKSNNIQNAILVDLWRFSGTPYIVNTQDDDSYVWSIRDDE